MSAQILIELLQEELNCLEWLRQALQEEHLALRQRQAPDIETAVKKKQEAMARLEAIFQNNKELLRTSGLPFTPEDINEYIKTSAAQGQERLSTLWKQRQKQLQQCRDQNQLNGNLINRNRHYTLRALNVLSGQELKPTAYGPGGDLLSSAPASRLLLGRA